VADVARKCLLVEIGLWVTLVDRSASQTYLIGNQLSAHALSVCRTDF